MTNPPIKVAILDLYNGTSNLGIACIYDLLHEWEKLNTIQIEITTFEVRLKGEIPNLNFDVYISSGGPGSPIDSQEDTWDLAYTNWLDQVYLAKKNVLLICHSFQIACRHFELGKVGPRMSKQIGILPIHPISANSLFDQLENPFFALESRIYQITAPNDEKINTLGAKIIALEKNRPQVPYERAIMGIEFNANMVGVQFHPEASCEKLRIHFHLPEIKSAIIESFGAEKWEKIIESIEDPNKIGKTYAHFIPNFLNKIIEK